MLAFFRKIPKWLILSSVLLVLIAIAVIVAFQITATPAVAEQPIPFNHQRMVKYGIACLYCHTDAMRSAEAGIPSVEKCVGCHRVIKPNRTDIKPVLDHYNAGEPIPWVRVNKLPRFVYFSHQPHVANGVDCETCHGDVAHMEVTVPVVKMTMGWCLDCHKQQPEAPQLTDCITCHQ